MLEANASLQESAKDGGTAASDEISKLLAEGNEFYSHKKYEEAAEKFSDAAARSAEKHGEESVENAYPLFLYGRALFHVAIAKSEVLGGAILKPLEESAKKDSASPNLKESEAGISAKPHMFSFADNIEVSNEVSSAEHGENDEEEDEGDDFAIAWETLEYSAILYRKQFDEATTGKQKHEIEEKLATIHDLLGEISLENESFDAACTDLEKALEIKERKYDQDDPRLSEAYYKLALALEFSNQVSSREAAAQQVEKAMNSVNFRIEKEKRSNGSEELIKDAEEMLEELEQKMKELKEKPEPVAVSNDENLAADTNSLKEEIKEAFDLSGLVRKKKEHVGNKRSAENSSLPSFKKEKTEQAE